MTGLNPKPLWEMMRNGDDLDSILNDVPDEFYAWITTKRDSLQQQFDTIFSDAHVAFTDIGGFATDPKNREARAAFAKKATQYKSLAPVLFALLDEHGWQDIIWKMIKPCGDEIPFKQEVEI